MSACRALMESNPADENPSFTFYKIVCNCGTSHGLLEESDLPGLDGQAWVQSRRWNMQQREMMKYNIQSTEVALEQNLLIYPLTATRLCL